MKYKKTAIIFGITGQDGAYLSHFLLQKGYRVIGTTRNKSSRNLYRLKKLKIIKKVNLLKGVATKWVKGEMYGLAAAAIAGLATAGTGILGQKTANTTGRAVMDLYVPGYGDVIPELEEDYYVDSLIDGIEVAAKGTELLPSSMIAKASAPVVDPMKDKIKDVIGAFK